MNHAFELQTRPFMKILKMQAEDEQAKDNA
jgi:hypothetical protein